MGFLKMLIRHNADLTIRDAKGQSPLYKACMLGRENMISLLLESLSFDIQDEDNNNETIFMALIRSRNLDLLHKIIVDEELVNQANYLGETPLHIAAKSGDIRIVSYLLENKAFIHRKNNLGETPLYYAVKYWNSDVIDFLISKGALMGMKTKAGESAYDLLLKPEHLTYITEREEKYKLKQYISTYPLHYAILLEDYELIQKNCVIRNLYREDIYGYTPIRLANCIGNPKIIKILKEKL
jgi:ankyrin repeat protein